MRPRLKERREPGGPSYWLLGPLDHSGTPPDPTVGRLLAAPAGAFGTDLQPVPALQGTGCSKCCVWHIRATVALGSSISSRGAWSGTGAGRRGCENRLAPLPCLVREQR